MKSNMQPVVLGAVASTSDPNLDVLTATDPGCVVCDVKINDAKGLDDPPESPFESDGTLTE